MLAVGIWIIFDFHVPYINYGTIKVFVGVIHWAE